MSTSLQSLLLDPWSVDDPSPLEEGQIWYRSDIGKVFLYLGGITRQLWPPIYGSNAHSAVLSSPSISTAPSPSLATALDLVTPSLEAGKYEIAFGYSWAMNTTVADFVGECVLRPDTSNIVLVSHVQEPKDAGGADGGTGSGTNQRHHFHRVVQGNFPGGSEMLRIRHGKTGTGTQASTIYEAYINLKRIA